MMNYGGGKELFCCGDVRKSFCVIVKICKNGNGWFIQSDSNECHAVSLEVGIMKHSRNHYR